MILAIASTFLSKINFHDFSLSAIATSFLSLYWDIYINFEHDWRQTENGLPLLFVLLLGHVWQIKLIDRRRRKIFFPMSADGQVKRMGQRVWSRRHIYQTRLSIFNDLNSGGG
ncbi:hypothetical protein [Laceyella putida]|uniref:Uncharacterized protein n=1 Tax=Laceyella putida TaxID=110101 RepID=A0ABW2RM17_9BACL